MEGQSGGVKPADCCLLLISAGVYTLNDLRTTHLNTRPHTFGGWVAVLVKQVPGFDEEAERVEKYYTTTTTTTNCLYCPSWLQPS